MISNIDFENVIGLGEWLRAVPYDVLRHGRLYTAEELYRGYEPSDDEAQDRESLANCYDGRVYQHFVSQGKIPVEVKETVARSMHDTDIHLAVVEFLKTHDPKRCIGIMGGHAILRTDPMFTTVTMLSKRLTEEGFYMVSGGGPGAMEATHLGAWMAGRTDEEAREAIRMLASAATSFKEHRWLSSALEVRRRFPQNQYVSLGIPTYLYGHEPSTPFATHIAKYFVNSVREDTILTIAFGGVVYTPGSAGTLQEIFQNAVQDHYLFFGFASPMIFMGKKFWTDDVPVYPMMRHMEENGRYKNLYLTLTDDPSEVVSVLKAFQETFKQQG